MTVARWYRYVITQPGIYSLFMESADGNTLADGYCIGYLFNGDTKVEITPNGMSPKTYWRIFSDDDSGGNQKPAVVINVTNTSISTNANVYTRNINHKGLPVTIYVLFCLYSDAKKLDNDIMVDTSNWPSSSQDEIAMNFRMERTETVPYKTPMTYQQMIDANVSENVAIVQNLLNKNPNETMDSLKKAIVSRNANSVNLKQTGDVYTVDATYKKTNYLKQADYDNEPNFWIESTVTVPFGSAIQLLGYGLTLNWTGSTITNKPFKAHIEVYKETAPTVKSGFDIKYNTGINRSTTPIGLTFSLIGGLLSQVLTGGDQILNRVGNLNLTGYIGNLTIKIRYDSRDTTLDSIVWTDAPLGLFKRTIKLASLAKTKYNR